MRHNDLKRYLEWRIEDLVMMTKSDHMRLHQTGHNNISCHLSEEAKKAKAEKCAVYFKRWREEHPDLAREAAIKAAKAVYSLPEDRMKAMLEKRRQKMTGKRWVNDGKASFLINKDDDLPAGCKYGRLKLKSDALNKAND